MPRMPAATYASGRPPTRPAARAARRPWSLLLLAAAVGCVFGPSPLRAQTLGSQTLEDLLVPRGHLRLGFAPSFTSWDSRFGVRDEGGALVESTELLGSDLTDPLGTSLFPGVAALEEQISQLTGSAWVGTLGSAQGAVTQNVTRLEFGGHVGVFDWLTVGAMLPWVKTRTAIDVAFDPAADADLGVNPSATNNAAVSLYLQRLESASQSTAARAQAACADAPGTPGCVSAQALADRVAAFTSSSVDAYFSSPFFPLQGSPIAGALTAAAAALEAELEAAGLSRIGTPAFSSRPVDGETFAQLPSGSSSGLQGSPLETIDRLWAAGDVELSAAVRLLEGEARDSAAAEPRLAWSLVGQGLVRLGTGEVDDPDTFLDVGTGDGQMDVEGLLLGKLRVGRRIGLRAGARYGVQGARTLIRRVAAPEAVLAPFTSRRAVRWSPASYLEVAVSPRWHVSDVLALAADYRLFTKGEDRYELLGATGDGSDPDPALLARETEVTVHEVALGLRYNTLGPRGDGGAGRPLELSVRLVHAAAGAGGQTPRTTRGELGIRIFRRFWGGS